MDLKGINIEILMGNETDGIVNELFKSFKQAYQEGLEKMGIYCIIVFIKQD